MVVLLNYLNFAQNIWFISHSLPPIRTVPQQDRSTDSVPVRMAGSQQTLRLAGNPQWNVVIISAKFFWLRLQPVVGPGLPMEGWGVCGCAKPKSGGANLLLWPIFPQTAWKWKKNVNRWGGGASLAPPPSTRQSTICRLRLKGKWRKTAYITNH